MSRNTLRQPGLIPTDEYLRKIEENNIPEDPDAYEKYIRQQLVDFRPDAPFFESDQPRDPSDRGSGNGSKERLSLRYEGTRSGVSPDLPDGTFLDHEFMERDPRGTQNMPDFAAARKQREARGRFIKFSNDNDFSVPETGINPVKMVSLIRGAQKQFKDRFQNFEESMDSWHNGSGARRGKKSHVAMITSDGTIVDLAEANSVQRTDPINLLSNRVPGIPRWTEPDHRVKTSKYGQVRPILDIGANKWNENRANSYLDHAAPVELNGQMINRMLANLILDVEGQRMAKQVAAQGADYSESEVTQIRDSKKHVHPDDVMKLLMLGMVSKTQLESAHEQFYSGSARNRGKQQTLDVRNMLGQVKINHEQAASMIQGTRLLGPKEAKDVRDAVLESGVRETHNVELKNRAASEKRVKNTLVREGLDTRHIEEERGIKRYAGIKPATHRNPQDVLDWERFAKNSKTQSNVNRRKTAAKNKTVDDLENDVDMREFNLPGRKKQQNPRSFGGRSIQSDYGDVHRAESLGKVDMKDVLSTMIMQA